MMEIKMTTKDANLTVLENLMVGIDQEAITLKVIYVQDNEEMDSSQMENNVKMISLLLTLMDEVLLAQLNQAGHVSITLHLLFQLEHLFEEMGLKCKEKVEMMEIKMMIKGELSCVMESFLDGIALLQEFLALLN